jgi:hypothetical protein
MDQVFPFGLPWPTEFYTVLYVLTFALHQALMHYVLAGSLFVAWTMAFPGTGAIPRYEQPIAAALRDWMPFALGAAITAGVAPLLFVQILYQREFYTANLLLSWRWMIVIPALIVAFYLLYLIKSPLMTGWPRFVRASIATLAGLLFVFVGFCWTANHLLSMNAAGWPAMYVTGALPFAASTVVLRMLIWGCGAFASMATIVAWQIVLPTGEPANGRVSGADPRPLSAVAICGLGLALVAAAAYLWEADSSFRALAFGIVGGPYVVVALVGVAIQAVLWWSAWRRASMSRTALALISGGWVLALVSVSVVREIGRWSTLDAAALIPRHQSAIEVGGLTVFLIFAGVNFTAIAACIWTVRRNAT